MKVIDTTVAIDHLRGRAEASAVLRDLIARREPVVASELVRYELGTGVRDGEVEAVEAFCRTVAWVPVDEEIARLAGAFARRYRPAHHVIDDVDFLIGATAHVLDAQLLTTNVRHFPMMEGLAPPY